MILNNIKHRQGERGFTIVELLVVIVVIGILAAITIVSYTGITARAKTAQAQSNAGSVQSVAEVYYAEQMKYPSTVATDFAATVAAKIPNGITVLTGAQVLTTNKVPTEVHYEYCGLDDTASTGAFGARYRFWDSQTSLVSTTILYSGTGTAALGQGVGVICHVWITPAS